MKTRDRILAQSLALFNDEGAAAVSTNRIAAELGISPGNLYYHFKSKPQILEALLKRFDDALAPFADAAASVHELDDLWLALHLLFENLNAFRFAYRDADYLMREHPQLAPRLHRTSMAQLATVRRIYAELQRGGTMRANEQEVELLALHTLLVVTCWQPFTRLVPELRDADSGRAAYHVLTLLGPYLADEARPYLVYLTHKYLK
ncbi:MAG: TetR/AcrR family transcriptional regulator [Proteobacteria bacterium]|nr:TetR/AcrR family transcriptional regulator [Pseudomonadota bacterium]